MPAIDKEYIKNLLQKLTPRQKIIIGVIFSFLLLWVFLRPGISQISNLKKNVSNLKISLDKKIMDYNKAMIDLKKLDEFIKQSQQAKHELAMLQKKLINQEDIPKIVGMLTSGEYGAKIYFKLIKTEPIRATQLYNILPISLKIKSDYLVLGKYLQQIEEEIPLVKLRNFNITKSEEAEDEKLDVEMEVEAYISK